MWRKSEFSNERENPRFDPTLANLGRFAFSGSPNNGFYWSQDGGLDFEPFVPPGVPAPDPAPPFSFHPKNTARIMIGWTTVYETPDRGQTWIKKLTPPARPTAVSYAGDHAAYVGAGEQLFQTFDDGQNWTPVSVVFAGGIVSICADVQNPDSVYVATPSHVFRRLNPQAQWEDVTGNLTMGINVMALRPIDRGADPWLFVGTDAGVFLASSMMGSNTEWMRFGIGLPDASVKDLEITSVRQLLLAATWGRGAWANVIPILTNVAPAVAGVGNNVYFFAKSLEGRIFYNRAMLGQGGLGWSEVDGDGRTGAAPAAGAVGTHVFVAVKGLNADPKNPLGELFLNQADLGQSFGEWFPMDFSTDVAPAVTGVGDNVYFFAKHVDGRIFYNRAKLGQGGVGWVEMEGNGRTDAAPAAGAVGTHVFVAVKGLDGKLYLNQADLGQSFGEWFPMS